MTAAANRFAAPAPPVLTFSTKEARADTDHMTAVTQYQRLEASGLWRASAEDQRREVIVSIGDATLVISDMNDRALTHWSLAAVERHNPGETPAVYGPDGDQTETLELAADEVEMIEAIEKLRTDLR